MEPYVKTLKEMMHQRGFSLIDSGDAVNAHGTETKEIIQLKPYSYLFQNGSDKKIYVYIISQTNRTLTILRKYIADLEEAYPTEEGYHHILILKKKPISSFIKTTKALEKHTVEIFMMKELKYNITKHVLVPKHELIPSTNKEVIDSIKDTYKLNSLNNLPIVFSTDPVSRFYGATPKDLFKITRNSKTTGAYETYRLVV